MPPRRRLITKFSVATVGSLWTYNYCNKNDFFRINKEIPSGATICVVGAGTVGIASALELHQRGFKVKLVEKLDKAAAATSCGNAGYLRKNPSGLHVDPSLFLDPDQGGKVYLDTFSDFWFWVWSCRWFYHFFMRNAEATHYYALYAQYAADLYWKDNSELITKFKNDAKFQRSVIDVATSEKQLKKFKEKFDNMISVEELINHENAISLLKQPLGGAYHTHTYTGNCNLYNNSIVDFLENEGVQMYFGAELEKINVDSKGAIENIAVRMSKPETFAANRLETIVKKRDTIKKQFENIEADAFVFCLGASTDKVLKLPGIILPLKGYSITMPSNVFESNFKHGFTIQPGNLYFSNMDIGIRITSFCDVDKNHKVREERFTELQELVKKNFPHITDTDFEKSYFWNGFRPMTPDDTPLICRFSHTNSFLNVGHSHRGWMLSHGSAKILSDIIENKQMTLDVKPLDVRQRFLFWRPKSWHWNTYWD